MAAKKGARRRYDLYGNPGTPEGRRLGGIRSLLTHHKYKGGGFKLLKHISRPRRSSSLAELLGVFIGDGHLSYYQASVVTNLKTDYGHAVYITKLIKKIFNVKTSIKKRPTEGAVVVVVSSKKFVDVISSFGMPKGNKLKNDPHIPLWIFGSKIYLRNFIRGLFDTDGCVFMDKHRFHSKIYVHLGWTITSASVTLLADIFRALTILGYHPTWKELTQKSVYLRRQKEINRYFSEIGSSNPKHLQRFKSFHGRVPKRS